MRLFIFIISGLITLFTHGAALGKNVQEPHVYTLGVVPQFEERRLIATWTPILNALEAKTGLQLKLKGSLNISAFEAELYQGVFDFAYANPYQTLISHEKQEYEPLVCSSSIKLQGILVVPQESSVKTLKDLQGAQIAFPSPKAFGASLLIQAELSRLHEIQFDPIYVKNHSSVYLYTIKDLVSAGSGVINSLQKQKKSIRDKLKIIYKTQEVMPHPIIVHKRIPSTHQDAIKAALLSLAQEKPNLIASIPMNDPIAVSIGAYESLKHLQIGSLR